MMDLSKLSTEDLIALRSGDLTKVSTEGLTALQAAASPAAQSANRDVASYAGLGARAATKGVLGLPALFTDAVGGTLNAAMDGGRALMQKAGVNMGERGPRFAPLLSSADSLMSAAGLPQPDTPAQRIASKAIELGTGAVTGAGALGAAAPAAGPVAKAVLERLSANHLSQLVSGGAAGAAGQHSAENGGGFGAQLVSSLLGGLGGAAAVGAGSAARQKAVDILASMRPQQTTREMTLAIEQKMVEALRQGGIDPDTITPAMRSALMADAQAALKTGGDLSPAAMARLADMRRLGMTPTRGRVTLDPYDVTQEQNAAKMAAAIGARDAKLPEIAQTNNQRLLQAVEDFKPSNDRAALGGGVVGQVRAADAARKARVDQLYEAARAKAGRDAEIDGASFTRRAAEDLQQNLAPKLGAEVDQALNDIATGKTPLTVGYAEQLKTMLGRKEAAAKNGGQGDLAYAYGIVRKALDDAPLRPAPQVNPGNLPAVAGTVPQSPAALGQDAIDAFNAARSAARQRFAWQESAKPIERALSDGVNADQFIRDNIISPNASLKDVARLAGTVGARGNQEVRASIVDHLKQAAIGKGNNAETANFSGRQWLSSLEGIGDRKLNLFFTKDEIEQLKAIGRTGTIETFQPRGSAVNNSNTASASAAALSKTWDALRPQLNKVPGATTLLSPAIDNIMLSLVEKPAQQFSGGLLMPVIQQQQGRAIDRLLLPMAVSGGLLGAPAGQ